MENKVCNQATSSELISAIDPLPEVRPSDEGIGSITPKPCISDHSILIVEPVLEEMLQLVMTVSRVGLHVTAAVSFAQAKQLLAGNAPSILLTTLRLGAYNGLHLVLYGQTIRPTQSALVVATDVDRSMQGDVERMGATFLVKPFGHRELVGAMMQTVFRGPDAMPVRAPYERRSTERRSVSQPVPFDRRETDRRQVVWPAPLASA